MRMILFPEQVTKRLDLPGHDELNDRGHIVTDLLIQMQRLSKSTCCTLCMLNLRCVRDALSLQAENNTHTQRRP